MAAGWVNARVVVSAVCLFGAVVAFGPAILFQSIGPALPLLVFGAALLSATNPPLDAARLDIVHPALWGRAESVRTVFRLGGDAAGPPLFGLLADSVFGGGSTTLMHTFLLFLIAPLLAGAFALFALRSYLADVAAVAASHR